MPIQSWRGAESKKKLGPWSWKQKITLNFCFSIGFPVVFPFQPHLPLLYIAIFKTTLHQVTVVESCASVFPKSPSATSRLKRLSARSKESATSSEVNFSMTTTSPSKALVEGCPGLPWTHPVPWGRLVGIFTIFYAAMVDLCGKCR